MGQPDLYPFVLAPNVIGKLHFVHERIQREAGRAMRPEYDAEVLKAVVTGLRKRVAAPPRG